MSDRLLDELLKRIAVLVSALRADLAQSTPPKPGARTPDESLRNIRRLAASARELLKLRDPNH